jgi:hypothetical protein
MALLSSDLMLLQTKVNISFPLRTRYNVNDPQRNNRPTALMSRYDVCLIARNASTPVIQKHTTILQQLFHQTLQSDDATVIYCYG